MGLPCDMRSLVAALSVVANIVGTVYLAPTDVEPEVLHAHRSYMVAVGRCNSGVQVVGVRPSRALLAAVLGFEVDFGCLDELHIALLADCQSLSVLALVVAPVVSAAAGPQPIDVSVGVGTLWIDGRSP